MTDLSYTNKDGLNFFEGFDNGFNYHRDGKESGDGYEHGGYPEITGETSPYTDTSYRTGDDTDFFHNGNTFDIIPSEGGGGILTLDNVAARAYYSNIDDFISQHPVFDIEAEIRNHEGGDIVSRYTLSGVSFDTAHEFANIKFIGNSNFLSEWGFGYDGPEYDRGCPVCLIDGGDLDGTYYGDRAIIKLFSPIYNNDAYYNYAFSVKLSYQEDWTRSYGTFGKYGNSLFFDKINNIARYGIGLDTVSNEEYNNLKKNVGNFVTVNYNGTDYDAEITYEEERDNILLSSENMPVDLICYDGKFFGDYKLSGLPYGEELLITVDLSTIAPPKPVVVVLESVEVYTPQDMELETGSTFSDHDFALTATYSDESKKLIAQNFIGLEAGHTYTPEEFEEITGYIAEGVEEVLAVDSITFSPYAVGDVVFDHDPTQEEPSYVTQTATYEGKSANFTINWANGGK